MKRFTHRELIHPLALHQDLRMSHCHFQRLDVVRIEMGKTAREAVQMKVLLLGPGWSVETPKGQTWHRHVPVPESQLQEKLPSLQT